MSLKIEENERLAALLTAQLQPNSRIAVEHSSVRAIAEQWRATYQRVLREFMELEKAEFAGDDHA